MTCTVCWTAIASTQLNVYEDSRLAINQVTNLIKVAGHSKVYLHDTLTKTWYLYTKGIRGRINECDIPENEVPKVYRLLISLGG